MDEKTKSSKNEAAQVACVAFGITPHKKGEFTERYPFG